KRLQQTEMNLLRLAGLWARLKQIWATLGVTDLVKYRLHWSLVDRVDQFYSFYQQPVGVKLKQLLLYHLYLLALFVRLIFVYAAVANNWRDYFNRFDYTFGYIFKRKQ